jgi:hypothetical protein
MWAKTADQETENGRKERSNAATIEGFEDE